MAKKKSLPWHKKQIDKKTFFGSILISFLICALTIFVYESPLNKSHFSVIDFFETWYYNNFVINHPKLPQINLIPTDQSTPIPTPTSTPAVIIPSNTEVPDKLQVNRSITQLEIRNNNPFQPFRTITDPDLVRNFIFPIYFLPLFPTPPVNPLPGSCTLNAQRVLYELKFYKKGALIHYGILSLTTCGGGWWITLDGIKHEFTDNDLFEPFQALFEKTFGVTNAQLYGR